MFEGRLGRVRIGLLMLLALAVVVLAVSENPFHGGVGPRLALGKRPGPMSYWASYGWGVLAVAGMLLAGLIASTPRWLGAATPVLHGEIRPPPTRLGVACVVAAMLWGALSGVPRLTHSFWDDEAYNVQNTMVGRWRVHPTGGEVFYDRVRWDDVFFGYVNPNNHVPHTVLGRVAYKVGDLIAPREDRGIDEWVVRMPSFLAGALSIAALAWFLWRFGFPHAAVLAAWLAALHPWILRYHTEARGYSLAMLLISVLLGAAAGVLQRGLWRRWLGYGVTQFVLMWTFVPTVYVVALVNVGVLGLVWRRRTLPEGRDQLTRFTLTTVGSALAWLVFMLPNLAQLVGYLGIEKDRVWITDHFRQSLAGHLLAGMPLHHSGGPDFPQLWTSWEAHPWLLSGWVALLLLALGLGVVRCLRGSASTRALGLALWLPAPLAFLQLWLTNDRAYVWYFIVFLPSALALIAIGATWPLSARSRWRPAAPLAGLACLGLLAGEAGFGAPALSVLRERSYFPLREAALATRPTLDASDPRNREILTASWSAPPRYYDPLHRYVPTSTEFEALLREADETGKPLFVNLGRLSIAGRRSPENQALVEDPRLFEKVAEFHGFTPRRSRVVYRYRGRASGEREAAVSSSGEIDSTAPRR